MQPKFISSVMLTAVVGSLVTSANAQVVGGDSNVNQIEGSVEFTAGSLLPEPVYSLSISTRSIGLSDPRTASTSASQNGAAWDYAVTVISDDVTHSVTASASLDGGSDYYRFGTQVSPAVPLEPAPSVTLNIGECSGAVSISFVKDGSPANVDAMQAYSYTDEGTGVISSAWQAYTSVNSTNSENFPVLGNGLDHRIDVRYRLGPIWDTKSFTFPVACGEQQEIVIDLDDGVPIELGGFRGLLDLQVEDEDPNSTMTASNGPHGNRGSDTIVAGYGAWEILNLLPSSADNGRKYRVYGSMNFLTPFGSQYFRTPRTEHAVPDGTIVDLGSTYVMQKGNVSGQIRMTGPADALARFVGVSSIVRPQLSGSGSAVYGSARQDITGAVLGEIFTGAYSLSVGTPGDVPGTWSPSLYTNTRDPENTDLAAYYTVTERTSAPRVVAPGDDSLANFNHCVVPVDAEIAINDGLPVGSSFRAPSMSFKATLNEDGYDYSVSGNARGLPRNSEAWDTKGSVPASLPAGYYNFTTTVSAQADTGEVSQTVLRTESADIECGSWVRPYTFDVEVGAVDCPGGDLDLLPFDMTATPIGGGGEVAHIFVHVNGGDADGGYEFDFCGGDAPACDQTGAFSENFDIDTSGLAQCGNSLEVFVVGKNDKVSKSAPKTFAFEQDGPEGPGCEDLALNLSGADSVSLDMYAVSSQLNECGLGQTQETVCFMTDSNGDEEMLLPVEEGTRIELAAGVHEGECFVVTECGARNCSFKATVSE